MEGPIRGERAPAPPVNANPPEYPGIYCIEGEWGPPHWSVRHLVDYVDFRPTIYRRSATRSELSYLIDQWLNECPSYTIGYFAFHGELGALQLSRGERGESIGLEEFFSELGQCQGKHIMISSCRVFKNEREMGSYRRRTGASSISGYLGGKGAPDGTDWYECSALDLFVMTNLLRHEPPKVQALVDSLCGGLKEKYGFAINC